MERGEWERGKVREWVTGKEICNATVERKKKIVRQAKSGKEENRRRQEKRH